MKPNDKLAKRLSESASDFLSKLQANENDRYKSWEHCYIFFHNMRSHTLNDSDYDQLCLHLAFYLASWGMYRGSSFLLQRDYRIHKKAVKEIMRKDYDCLFGIECCALEDHKKSKLLWNLYEKIKSFYTPVREAVRKENPKDDDEDKKDNENELSATLVTKILMGTLGCIPAYDRYFIEGVKLKEVKIDGKFKKFKAATTGICNENSLNKLIEFYRANKAIFDNECKKMEITDVVYPEGKICKLPYPQMKMLDMAFWQIGYEKALRDDKKKKAEAKAKRMAKKS